MTHFDLEAWLASDLYVFASILLKSGHMDTAEGDWLSVLAWSFFQELREGPIFTEGEAVLSLALGAANQTIAAGQLWIETAEGVRFSNTGAPGSPGASVLVTPASPQRVTIRAEFAGEDANVPTGTITKMGTPVPGMSCNNPYGEDDALVRWMTAAGGVPNEALSYLDLSTIDPSGRAA
jgi:uncharacterized phage protein gp47/JayE